MVELNGETAIASPPPRSTAPHSLCSAPPRGFGIVDRLVDSLLDDATFFGNDVMQRYCAGFYLDMISSAVAKSLRLIASRAIGCDRPVLVVADRTCWVARKSRMPEPGR
jgi:hypothetical protein